MMICRCPHCGTPFRVTPEQLKVRNGMVRCGECKSVFNALDNLIEEKPARPATPPVANVAATYGAAARREPLPGADDPRDVAARLVADADSPRAATETIPCTNASAGTQPSPDDATPAAPAPTPAATIPDASETPSGATQDTPPLATPTLSPETAPLTNDEESTADTPTAPDVREEAIAAGLVAPREIRAAPGYSRWAETALSGSGPLFAPPPRNFRAIYLLLSALLALALAAQAVHHSRTEIATRWPATRPALEQTCALMGCSVPLPRLADLVSIETSDLHADPERGGLLVLQALLRNRADFPQDYPALELTLTDIEDKAVARRILLPADYLPAGTLSAAVGGLVFAPGTEVEVKIWLDPKDAGAAGYRLFLFYP